VTDAGSDDGVFDDAVAAQYDVDVASMYAPEVLGPTVDVLEELAAGGAALEFAVGTGRVALALAERGLPVSGIELSASMLERLRAKPGSERIAAVVGDMTAATVPGEFALVYLVFNTIGNVTTQEGQVQCFLNASRHLKPGGRFVIELEVPALRRLPVGERFVTFQVSGGYAGVDEYDTVNQLLTSHHFNVEPDGTGRIFTTPQRYAWRAELDLMARLAGMRLERRWSGWDKSEFTAESAAHVSVWIKE